MKKVIYGGSFDPVTYGHRDIIERASKYFDQLTVGIGVNPEKESKYLFSLQERLFLTREALKDIMNIDIQAYRGMTTDFAYENNYSLIIRWLRNIADFQAEQSLDQAFKRQLTPGIDVFYLMGDQAKLDLSSSAVKAVLKEQGDIRDYAPLIVKQATEGRLLGQYLAGITWSIGSGKSFSTERFLELCKINGIKWHHLDLDEIGHEILWLLQEPIYQTTRQNIIEIFGDVGNEDGSIDTKKLWPKVFWNAEKMETLNQIMHEPLKTRTRRLMYNQKWLILYNAALIAEKNSSSFVNNNIVLVDVDPETQMQRLMGRNHSAEAAAKRINSQFTTDEKRKIFSQEIEKSWHGLLIDLKTPYSNKSEEIAFNKLLAQIDTFGELRFSGLLNRLGIKEDPTKLFMELRNIYDRPLSPTAQRDEITKKMEGNYHKRLHIIDCLNEFYQIRHLIKNPDVIECAILFHDIIYTPGSKTNEEDSAEFAEKILTKRGLPKDFIEEVKRYIVLTKHNKNPDTEDGKYLVDIDTSIFGKDPRKYQQYAKDIRREYYTIPEKTYKEGRKNILKFFLDKENIFQTEHFRDKYQDQAKINLEQEISWL